MPYGQRRLVAVSFLGIPGLKYGFRTSVADTTSTALGHIDALSGTGGYIPGVILGVNSPKPATAKKYFGTGTKRHESSFIDSSKFDSARADGWVITPAKPQRMRSTPYSKAVTVDLKVSDPALAADGTETDPGVVIQYAWRMPADQYAKLTATDKTTLGIADVKSSDWGKLILGANSHKPARASKTVTADGKPITITTFVASNKVDSLANGWA